ncbi:hypothetical protein A8F94_10865 [Bacillus sp. FJAT-27225]|uniref:glycosyltransferase family 1 protein n=1 Tax=Bacillus sp. FJAT-27225 TaxID=1743144 RepID=UPI00080C30DB|nr:glycosyltransferase family 1 protein [Bacillus sp. FJAT-27225]OCA88291.1 hypothetical protein A8F94_10865 [Bacillus sp. FJAT-27225]
MNKPVRVLHFVSIMNQAGQETLLMNVYRKLDREKVQFDFLCTVHEKGDFDDEIYALGGKIYYLPTGNYNSGVLRYVSEFLRIYKFLKSHGRYRIFHIHTYHALNGFISSLAAKLSGIRKVILHSHNSNAPHPELHKFIRLFLNFLTIDRFACSQLAGRWMFGNRKKDGKNIKIINNGIDTKKFVFNSTAREQTRTNLGLNDKLVIGHIGRFNYQKNHEFLIDIFNEIYIKNKDAVLLLVGRGELEDQMKDKVSKLGLNSSVFFTGIRSDIPNLLNAMDVFLFPSLFEGLGIVLIEAQTSGLKCLASDKVPMEAKVTDHLEIKSLNDSPESWADMVLKISRYKRESSLEQVIDAGYDIEYTANSLQSFYLNQ